MIGLHDFAWDFYISFLFSCSLFFLDLSVVDGIDETLFSYTIIWIPDVPPLLLVLVCGGTTEPRGSKAQVRRAVREVISLF